MDTIILTFENGEKREYIRGVKFQDVVNDIKRLYQFDILCGKFKNQIIDYEDSILKSGNLILYDLNTKEGNKIYEKGLTILFESCVREILGKDTVIKISYSIDRGIYCKVNKELSDSIVKDIKQLMIEKVNKGIPFVKVETSKNDILVYITIYIFI